MSNENSKQKVILWVEDDRLLVELYVDMLKAAGNYKVDFLERGKLAIDRINEIAEGKAYKPDLIMLDLLLPDINGDKILEFIRQTPATKDIPVFILTNYGGEQMETKLTRDLDAEKYLVKTDWSPVKLIPLIKEKLGA